MRKASLAALTLLLLGGCADSAKEIETEVSKPPMTNTSEAGSDATLVDASVRLASTLANARKADKRVIVHLGAPW